MNAGKSLELIRVAYNYEERGMRVLVLTPAVDDRGGVGRIVSRTGIIRDALPIFDATNILTLFMAENEKEHVACVLIDEGQFLKKHHILELTEIVDSCDTPVMVYGLKNDFRNELFEGSYHLLVYADKIEEIKTICWCGRKATMVARVVDGKFVKSGEQVVIGGHDMYVSLCRKHYNDGRIGGEGTRPSEKVPSEKPAKPAAIP
jgi:thymidine kinase